MIYCSFGQWPFQEPKSEVPTIYKAYVRGYAPEIWLYMVQYLHFGILKFPLICFFFSKMEVTQNGWLSMQHSVNIGDFGAPLFQETSICTVD